MLCKIIYLFENHIIKKPSLPPSKSRPFQEDCYTATPKYVISVLTSLCALSERHEKIISMHANESGRQGDVFYKPSTATFCTVSSPHNIYQSRTRVALLLTPRSKAWALMSPLTECASVLIMSTACSIKCKSSPLSTRACSSN